jgi:hypothetical protein
MSTHEEWCAEGRRFCEQREKLALEEGHLQFAIGDWLVEGSASGFLGSFDDCYKTAAQLTGYSASSLHTFRYVASKVSACIRMQTLPWAVHQQVAPLKPEYQHRILQRADSEKMSVAAVRRLVSTLPKHVVPKTAAELLTAMQTPPDIEGMGDSVDAKISKSRVVGWCRDVLKRACVSEATEEAWDFCLPHMSQDFRLAQAQRMRAAAARLIDLADKVESFKRCE